MASCMQRKVIIMKYYRIKLCFGFESLMLVTEGQKIPNKWVQKPNLAKSHNKSAS